MTIAVLTSNPCATEDMATASLGGAIAEYGRGGHKVSVREMTTQETEAGWIATVSVEIEDLEEEEEAEQKESELRKVEEQIGHDNEVSHMMHLVPGSVAGSAFPAIEEIVDANAIVEQNQEMMDSIEAPDTLAQETIGIDQNANVLAQELENDFTQAMAVEPPPEDSAVDLALLYRRPDTPVSALTADELEEEAARRRHQEERLSLFRSNLSTEAAAPAPQE